MATPIPARFVEYLPAIFRQDEVAGEPFLGRFLQAFEAIFAGLQQELDAIPDLFMMTPTPSLQFEARAGTDILRLDSAAGLCPRDLLQLVDADPARIEFVEVKSVPQDLLPTTVSLTLPLRFGHSQGTPIGVVGPPGPSVLLSLPVRVGQAILTMAEASALGVARGDVLRIDEGAITEYAQVVSVAGAAVTVTPTLQSPHELGRPVTLMSPAPRTTPPLAFAHATRTGAELVLRTPALAGEAFIELDTVIGLAVGEVLHLREVDPGQGEFLQVKALPPEPESGRPGVVRGSIELFQPLRFSHASGVGLRVVGAQVGATRLAGQVDGEAASLVIEDPNGLGAEIGDVLQVDEGSAVEYTQILAIAAQTVTVTPPLRQRHAIGQPVLRRAPSGSGTAFLSWLAGWIGLVLRPDRGERWNRELLRLAGRIWPWRGTKIGVEAFLNAYLRGEAQATLFEPANPLQIGLVSTVGVDTIVCGGLPHFFWVDIATDAHNQWLYQPEGLNEMVQAGHQALRREKPAHTYYDLRLRAHTLQIGIHPETEVGARVGDTTLLWEAPLIIPGDR
jgi:hypothetical protein